MAPPKDTDPNEPVTSIITPSRVEYVYTPGEALSLIHI